MYFGAGPSPCIVIMFFCFIVLCDDVLLCDFSLCVSGFLLIQTPNCDTMKVAVIFILLFATVLCRPVSYFLCRFKTKIILTKLRTVALLFHYYFIFHVPFITRLVNLLHFVVYFFDCDCFYFLGEKGFWQFWELWRSGEYPKRQMQIEREKKHWDIRTDSFVHRWDGQHLKPSRKRRQWLLRPVHHKYRSNI